jgi:transcriptional regulator with XRE-family HTH domain
MHEQTPPAFGAILRRLRRAEGFTQEDLAERAGLSVRTVSDLERGLKSTPQASTVEMLAEGLSLSPEDREALLASVPKRGAQAGARADHASFLELARSADPIGGKGEG